MSSRPDGYAAEITGHHHAYHRAERPTNPYQADDIAAPVAWRIAELADRNFLIAGLCNHQPVRADEIQFSGRIDDALAEFLARISAVGDQVFVSMS